ncbi:MAG: hypothetical protein CL910_13495 [Deltaproteobacteria bacterium]|nr:hypothetical protein [Deltaproteobacteria bacterium]
MLPASQIPSLVGPDGRLPSRQQAARRLVLGRVRQEEVAGEFRAQIERVLAAGIEVDHLDSHCHLHAHPTVWRALREVVEETGIRRVRRSEARPGIDFLHATLRRRVLGIGITLASRFSRRAPEPSLRSPDRFLGLVRSGEIDAGWICQAIRSLEPGSVTELMLHPGDGDVFPGLSEDHAPEQRRRELEAALAPQVRETLEACNVELTTYRQVTPC